MSTQPVALVVGASRGLGLIIATELVRLGHRVVIASRTESDLDRAVEQLGGPDVAERRVCDVRDRDSVRRLVEDVEASVGPIEVVLTVAGIMRVGPMEAMTFEDFEAAIDTMTWGPINVALTVLPHMRARGHGRIGTITSVGGMVSPPHILPYATAKFGAVGFSDGLAAALQGTGVTATTIVPGLMRTGSHELATFVGDAEKEFAWFGPAASLPLVTVDAERAVRRMVSGTLRGKPMVIISPLTWVGVRVRGLMPATTTRVMGLANRLLPGMPEDASRTLKGWEAQDRLDSNLVNRLTSWGRTAAERFNERRSSRSTTP